MDLSGDYCGQGSRLSTFRLNIEIELWILQKQCRAIDNYDVFTLIRLSSDHYKGILYSLCSIRAYFPSRRNITNQFHIEFLKLFQSYIKFFYNQQIKLTFSTINKFFKFKGKMFEHPQFLKDFPSILFMSQLPGKGQRSKLVHSFVYSSLSSMKKKISTIIF